MRIHRFVLGLAVATMGLLGVGVQAASASTITTPPNADSVQTVPMGAAYGVTGQIGACHWSATVGAYLGTSFTKLTSYPAPGCTAGGIAPLGQGAFVWETAQDAVWFTQVVRCTPTGPLACCPPGCTQIYLPGAFGYATSLNYTRAPTTWRASWIIACGVVTLGTASFDACEWVQIKT